MAAVDDKEIDGTIFKVEAWLSKTLNQLSCDTATDVTTVQCKKFVKDKLAVLLAESYQLVRLQNDKLRQMKVALSSTKSQLIENQKWVISLQEQVISCKEKQLEAVQTTVKETVETQLKSYSDAVQDNVIVCHPESSVTPETLKQVVKTVVQEEDRGKNVMLFGLSEENSEDISFKVGEVMEEIGLKPAMELSRVGKKKEKCIRPVKVTLSSSSTANQILNEARKLRLSEKFASVFISPDRTFEDRVKHRLLVQDLRKKKSSEPDKRHYIKGGTIHSESKVAK